MPNTTPNLGLIKPLVTENYDIAKVTNENADILDLEIKTVKDDVLEKQDILVSGTNIKTVNGASILASGDVELLPRNNPVAIGTQTLPNIVTNGIKFPATQVPSSDPNTLDDYEKGTWTPVIVGGTTAGVGTYVARNGSYIKIGKMVNVDLTIITSAHTGTGDMLITLPFVVVGNSIGTAFLSETTFTGSFIVSRALNNTQTLDLRSITSNATASVVPIDPTTTMIVSIVYQTN